MSPFSRQTGSSLRQGATPLFQEASIVLNANDPVTLLQGQQLCTGTDLQDVPSPPQMIRWIAFGFCGYLRWMSYLAACPADLCFYYLYLSDVFLVISLESISCWLGQGTMKIESHCKHSWEALIPPSAFTVESTALSQCFTLAGKPLSCFLTFLLLA